MARSLSLKDCSGLADRTKRFGQPSNPQVLLDHRPADECEKDKHNEGRHRTRVFAVVDHGCHRSQHDDDAEHDAEGSCHGCRQQQRHQQLKGARDEMKPVRVAPTLVFGADLLHREGVDDESEGEESGKRPNQTLKCQALDPRDRAHCVTSPVLTKRAACSIDAMPSSSMGANSCQPWHMPSKIFSSALTPAAFMRLTSVTESSCSRSQLPTCTSVGGSPRKLA